MQPVPNVRKSKKQPLLSFNTYKHFQCLCGSQPETLKCRTQQMHGWLYSLTSTKQTSKEHNTDVVLDKHTISGHSVLLQETKIASLPGISKNREIVDCLSYPLFLYNFHPHQLSSSFQCSKNTLVKKSNHLHLENFQSCSLAMTFCCSYGLTNSTTSQKPKQDQQ